LGVAGSWGALVFSILIMFFKGFPIFCYKVTAKKGTTPVFDWRTFITTYLGIPLYIAMFMGYKFAMKTSIIRPEDADMYSGKARIDREEAEYLAQEAAKKGGPETKGEKIYRLTLGWLF
jgi:amino acid transporter